MFIASVNALAHYGNPAYSAAKAGLVAYAKAIAVERGAQGRARQCRLPRLGAHARLGSSLANGRPISWRASTPHYPLGRLVTPRGGRAHGAVPRQRRRLGHHRRRHSRRRGPHRRQSSLRARRAREAEAMARLQIKQLVKSYGATPRAARRRSRCRRRRVRRAGRAVRLRQVDASAHDRRARRDLVGRNVDRRQARQCARRRSSATSRWCSRATRCFRIST